jgi:uncharacterized protein YndB with AHSA1/START domain
MEPIAITALFDASADEVWNALSRKDELVKWYFPLQEYQFEEGQTFTFYESAQSEKYFHRCRFLKIEPLSQIEYSWTHPEHSAGTSVVRWELASEGSRTRVTLRHTGVESFADAGPEFARENFLEGWTTILHKNLRNHLYNVEKLCFVTEIRRLPEVVWKTLWEQETYRQWAGEFSPGSYYRGEMEKGNRIHFLAPDGNGMYSEVVECSEPEKMVFKHLGWITNYLEMPVDEETGRWTGNMETYQLIPHPTGTILKVEVEAVEEHTDFFNSKLPPALEKLSKLCITS